MKATEPFAPTTFEEVKRAQNSFEMEDEYGGAVIVDFDQLQAAIDTLIADRRVAANKGKIVQGLSDALGFAKGLDDGDAVRIYHATEFFMDGIRYNPGTYEIRKIMDAVPAPEVDF